MFYPVTSFACVLQAEVAQGIASSSEEQNASTENVVEVVQTLSKIADELNRQVYYLMTNKNLLLIKRRFFIVKLKFCFSISFFERKAV